MIVYRLIRIYVRIKKDIQKNEKRRLKKLEKHALLEMKRKEEK